jgi:glycosyltransferase involved in cell wall biosynthesis
MPKAAWCGTVYHGLPLTLHTYRKAPGEYLAFLGRISPDKGIERAIEIARLSGMPLKIAAKIYDEDRSYYERSIKPLLAGSDIAEFVGEVGGKEKDDFLGNARALLFPVEWAEPFGLVMIESLACGTPVIAWKRGAVPEIIEDGIHGFVVENIAEAVNAVNALEILNRKNCRRQFEKHFRSGQMASAYVQIYEQQIRSMERR